MIVDCHTHVDLEKPEPDVSGHLAAADMVDACIVLAFPGSGRQETNQALAQYVAGHKTKMIGFGIVGIFATGSTFKQVVASTQEFINKEKAEEPMGE